MEKELYLDQALIAYEQKDVYPFHMPGHKRQVMSLGLPEQIDITEVDGFDNLHHPEGIIAEGQARMARVFEADASFFLVNGSTCGLLAAISAAVPRGGKILIGRNCHKAVYHGILLRGLKVEYVYPEQTDWGIQGSIDPQDVRAKLEDCPDIQAVLITSPTYDGIVSDIEEISRIAHQYNVPLIVDEAHGAHFGFSDGFPKKAHQLGADVVIESLHKTLPAFTQTAALHVAGDRVDQKALQKYLGIYQTSSPSYIFMAGIDRCTRLLEQEGKELFAVYEDRLCHFYERAEQLRCLRVMPQQMQENATGIWDRDLSKILIFTEGYMDGNALAEELLEVYGIQLEMTSAHYATALTSFMDTEEGFDRLWKALQEIDKRLSREDAKDISMTELLARLYQPKQKQMEIETASECDTAVISLKHGAGRISCEFAYLYPPGIPFLVPGEEITEEVVELALVLAQRGYELQGLEDLTGKTIKVAT